MILMLLLYTILYVTTTMTISAILLQPHKSEGLTEGSTVFGVSVDGGPLVKITALLSLITLAVILAIHFLT